MPLRVPTITQLELDSLLLEIQHASSIFPANTNQFVVLTAGALDNAWSAWVEIEDSSGNKFSDEATADLHISALMVEDTNIKDEVYLLEIAYGDDYTPVTPYRFIAGDTTKLPAVQHASVRADHIPAGETIYYRMKCETGGKTCDVHIRYHLHD